MSRNKYHTPTQQDFWLDLIGRHVRVSVYLVNGIRLKGTVLSTDDYSLMLWDGKATELVFKHSLSTLVLES